MILKHTRTLTTSQVNNLVGSPLISASKVYPAGNVAGAVTCTIMGKSGRTRFVCGVDAEVAMLPLWRVLLLICFDLLQQNEGYIAIW